MLLVFLGVRKARRRERGAFFGWGRGGTGLKTIVKFPPSPPKLARKRPFSKTAPETQPMALFVGCLGLGRASPLTSQRRRNTRRCAQVGLLIFLMFMLKIKGKIKNVEIFQNVLKQEKCFKNMFGKKAKAKIPKLFQKEDINLKTWERDWG